MKLLYVVVLLFLIALYINYNVKRQRRLYLRNFFYEGFDGLGDTTKILGWIISIMFAVIGILLIASTIKNSQ